MKRPLLLAVLAAAFAAAALAARPVQLVAPGDGAMLDGGSTAELAWTAKSFPGQVEEWEAFLSVDGGRYFAVRITPHLDLGVRRFRFHVPNVAAANARILIRIGDERNERAFVLPQRFRIVPHAAVLDSTLSVAVADHGGESALPAAPPTVEWVAGDRRGGGLTTRRSADPGSLSAHLALLCDDEFAAAAQLNDSAAVRPAGGGLLGAVPRASALRRGTLPRALRPVLLLTTRLNI